MCIDAIALEFYEVRGFGVYCQIVHDFLWGHKTFGLRIPAVFGKGIIRLLTSGNSAVGSPGPD